VHTESKSDTNLKMGPLFEEVTHSIRVAVYTHYLEEQSDPEENRYVWAYQVSISNEGHETVQLLNRYWHITESSGKIKEVRGEGVVGEQPTLKPGDIYRYTSGTPLKSPSGFMFGSYEMINEAGEFFDIAVPSFSLDIPAHRVVN
jgi:ApaG protein